MALGVALAFLIASPQRTPWYDVMIYPLLALMPATRLDWIVVARSVAGAVGSLPRPFYVGCIQRCFLRRSESVPQGLLPLSLSPAAPGCSGCAVQTTGGRPAVTKPVASR